MSVYVEGLAIWADIGIPLEPNGAQWSPMEHGWLERPDGVAPLARRVG
jgi:hypothetical protein